MMIGIVLTYATDKRWNSSKYQRYHSCDDEASQIKLENRQKQVKMPKYKECDERDDKCAVKSQNMRFDPESTGDFD